ncbi:MAG: histidine phosphatase family protein [Chloroflexi bacterium]|nr:histidine phosphatase family protein [Chloroflexota bacterium]
MRELILIRHAESQLDPSTPAEAWGLTSTGVKQARAVGAELKDAGIVAIFCSLEPKARQTADLIADMVGLRSRNLKDLAEHRRDSWGFLGDEEFNQAIHEVFDVPDTSVIGAETGKRALSRFTNAIAAADEKSSPGPIALVSHGTVMSLFLSKTTGEPAGPIWEAMDFAEVFRVEWEAPV